MTDKQKTTVLESLSQPVRKAFEPLLREKPITTAKLRSTVDTYLERVLETAARVPSAEPAVARKAAAESIDLLDASGADEDEAPDILIQAAVRYFVIASDGQSDLSPGGFDDDLEVLAAVRKTLKL